MKVKLFWRDSPNAFPKGNASDFENEINAWLKENPRIKVTSIQQSSSGAGVGAGGSLWLISVWYEDPA